MKSILDYTLEVMREHDLTEDMILWVGTDDGAAFMGGWERFKEIYSEVEHRFWGGWAKDPVGDNTVIVFNNNSWLSRYYNDGDVGWRFNKVPQRISAVYSVISSAPTIKKEVYATGTVEYDYKEDFNRNEP
jgi:hypothetical protein